MQSSWLAPRKPWQKGLHAAPAGSPAASSAFFLSCPRGSPTLRTVSRLISSLHMQHRRSAARMRMNWRAEQGNLHVGHSDQSASVMRFPVEMSKGMMFWQLMHCSSVSGPGMLQKGHSSSASSASSASLSGLRTMSSIFFLYFIATWFLYSGLINIEAYSKAVFLRPARWHSITVDVRMGTTCLGNLEMLRATRISIRAAVVWSSMAMRLLTSV
mmetsp:Transcript_36982/g.82212  ORF Transcript_36982/g.82212 Transcript_36982/m.82212 type:complete len:214 (-) Transcript_36982:3803-4444(-)